VRLRLAREAASLEVKELADRIGASSSAISQLESGRTKPRAETLLRIALVLAVPVEFFGVADPPSLSAERCHFRSLRVATKRERQFVLARGKILREIVSYLEDYVEFPSEGVRSLQERLVVRDKATLSQSVE